MAIDSRHFPCFGDSGDLGYLGWVTAMVLFLTAMVLFLTPIYIEPKKQYWDMIHVFGNIHVIL